MNSNKSKKNINIGFISTRLCGTDGVSLETAKWAEIFSEDGFNCFYLAGELDRPKTKSMVVPKMHFNHPEIIEIYNGCFGGQVRKLHITNKISKTKDELKKSIYSFIKTFKINLLVSENTLTIPLNIPLGLALCEVVSESGIAMIAHHHDFYWERKRFLINAIEDYLDMAFPPHLASMQHVVINSIAKRMISYRRGIAATLIPNVMNFEKIHTLNDNYSDDIRKNLGIGKDEFFILQPTRVVKRKGIEHAIELVSRLGIKAKLVISHASGDEGNSYENRVKEYASLLNINAIFVSDIIKQHRGRTDDGRKIYTLADVYSHADLVTYPSYIEGFGNAFLEAVYYRKPIFVNNYSIFATDIKPKGFKAIVFDDYITKQTISLTKKILLDPKLSKEMTDHNYKLCLKHFSYNVLRQKLRMLIMDYFGIFEHQKK